MQYTEYQRIRKLRKILDIIAYGSLGIDVAIAVVTLIGLNIYSQQLNHIQYYLNLALTAEVIVTMVILVSLAYLYHYEKILDNLASLSRALTGSKKGKHR